MPCWRTRRSICAAKFGTFCSSAKAMRFAPSPCTARRPDTPRPDGARHVIRPAADTGLGRVAGTSRSVQIADVQDGGGLCRSILCRRRRSTRRRAQHAYRSDAQGRGSDRRHRDLPPGGSAVHRQADRAGQRTSPPRPSSPSRIRGCSTSCANRCSSRPPPPTCSRLSAARPSILKRCSIRWSSRPPDFARRTWRPCRRPKGTDLLIMRPAMASRRSSMSTWQGLRFEPGRGHGCRTSRA